MLHFCAVKAARSEAFHVSVLEVIHENKWWRCQGTNVAVHFLEITVFPNILNFLGIFWETIVAYELALTFFDSNSWQQS